MRSMAWRTVAVVVTRATSAFGVRKKAMFMGFAADAPRIARLVVPRLAASKLCRRVASLDRRERRNDDEGRAQAWSERTKQPRCANDDRVTYPVVTERPRIARRVELADFLRSRRARVQPDD